MVSRLRQYLQRYTSRHIIESTSSSVNQVLEVVRVGDRILLNAANTNYSYGGLHRVFQKAFNEISVEQRPIGKVLILGFGVGSVASILQEELNIECQITAVENDPEVVRLGKQHFNIHRFKRLEIIEGDAANFVKEHMELFDLIIVDVYVDFEVPESCENEEFIKDVISCLSHGGMMLYNKLIYNNDAAQQAKALEEKFNEMPGSTQVLKIRENVVNKVIVFEKYDPGSRI